MNYISAREAAERWGYSFRYVQKLLHDGKIEGAVKFERSWMIPEAAANPRGQNKSEAAQASPYLPYVFLIASVPLRHGNAETGSAEPRPVRTVMTEAESAEYEAELAYLRGDFNRILEYAKTVPVSASTYLCSRTIALFAAVNLGDCDTYGLVTSQLKSVVRHSDNPQSVMYAQACLVTAEFSMYTPGRVPEWFAEMDFSGFPPESRGWLMYIYAKKLQNEMKYEQAFLIASTALAMSHADGVFTSAEIYLLLTCAAASYPSGKLNVTEYYMQKAMALALPYGFVTPFTESVMLYGGILEKCLMKYWSRFYDSVMNSADSAWRSWAGIHNRTAQSEIPLALTLQEYRAAQLLTHSMTYAQTAKRMNLSLSRVKDLVSSIYGKLDIHNKKELKKYIL